MGSLEGPWGRHGTTPWDPPADPGGGGMLCFRNDWLREGAGDEQIFSQTLNTRGAFGTEYTRLKSYPYRVPSSQSSSSTILSGRGPVPPVPPAGGAHPALL